MQLVVLLGTCLAGVRRLSETHTFGRQLFVPGMCWSQGQLVIAALHQGLVVVGPTPSVC